MSEGTGKPLGKKDAMIGIICTLITILQWMLAIVSIGFLVRLMVFLFSIGWTVFSFKFGR